MLHTLPMDIILEIFYILDISSILGLRQTCKRICDISKAHTVWAVAFKRSTQALPFKHYLDRPLRSFSAEALETMVTNMAKLNTNWTGDHPKPTRIRELPGPYAANYITKLLPGGRWLLTALEDGSGRIVVYDLDMPAMNPQTLLKLDGSADRQEPYLLTVSIHGDEEFMMFDLALLYQTLGDLTSPLRVSIWRIVLDLDREPLPFQSHHLRSFDIRPFGVARSISMRDELFLRTSGHLRSFQMRFDVFQWRQCSLTCHRKASFMTADLKLVYGASYLLPHNRILCIVQSSLLVYDIPEMNNVKNLEDTAMPAVAQPHWVFDFHEPRSFILAVSPPDPWSRASTEYTSVTFSNTNNLYIVLIPADGGSPLHGEQILSLDGKRYMDKTMGVGHYRGVWLYAFSRAAGALTFLHRMIPRATKTAMWEPDAPYKGQGLERPLEIAGKVMEYQPLFDEQSGRLVFTVWGATRKLGNLVADFV